MSTIRQSLHAATDRLAAVSSSPRLDAEILLAHVLGRSRTWLFTEDQREIPAAEQQRFDELIARRAALEPIAYIIGQREFWGLNLLVDRRVLVPRPETETLVELALQQAPRDRSITIADIGTGSGAIAIALASELPLSEVLAVDVSLDALEVARSNIARFGLADRISVLHGDGLEPLSYPVDLLVSNPPYMLMERVDANVQRWEPHLALLGGGAHGFDLPARLIDRLPMYLKAGGAALFEIGEWQGKLAQEYAARVFPGAAVSLHADLWGHDRFLLIKRTTDASIETPVG